MWLCNQCQPRPRPAIDLAIAYTGKPFREAAASSMTFSVIVSCRWFGASRKIQRRISPAPGRAGIAAPPCVTMTSSIEYLCHRRVGLDTYPGCLRTSTREPYWTTRRFRHPAMLALIRDPAGNAISVHRTYLATDGNGKANLDPARKAAGPFGCGAR